MDLLSGVAISCKKRKPGGAIEGGFDGGKKSRCDLWKSRGRVGDKKVSRRHGKKRRRGGGAPAKGEVRKAPEQPEKEKKNGAGVFRSLPADSFYLPRRERGDEPGFKPRRGQRLKKKRAKCRIRPSKLVRWGKKAERHPRGLRPPAVPHQGGPSLKDGEPS